MATSGPRERPSVAAGRDGGFRPCALRAEPSFSGGMGLAAGELDDAMCAERELVHDERDYARNAHESLSPGDWVAFKVALTGHSGVAFLDGQVTRTLGPGVCVAHCEPVPFSELAHTACADPAAAATLGALGEVQVSARHDGERWRVTGMQACDGAVRKRARLGVANAGRAPGHSSRAMGGGARDLDRDTSPCTMNDSGDECALARCGSDSDCDSRSAFDCVARGVDSAAAWQACDDDDDDECGQSDAHPAFVRGRARDRYTTALAHRARGNERYAAREFNGALIEWARALALLTDSPADQPLRALVHANRAAGFIHLRQFAAADAEACECLRLEPSHVKARWRRGIAREWLGLTTDALADYALVADSGDVWPADAARARLALLVGAERAGGGADGSGDSTADRFAGGDLGWNSSSDALGYGTSGGAEPMAADSPHDMWGEARAPASSPTALPDRRVTRKRRAEDAL